MRSYLRRKIQLSKLTKLTLAIPSPKGIFDLPMTITLSVVIPTYNSYKTLRKTLASLSESDYKAHEILVVDDASTDNSSDLAAEFPDTTWHRLDTNSGPAFARNFGVERSQGTVIVFLDADVIVRPDTLHVIADFFAVSPDHHLLTGIYDPQPANAGALPKYKALQCQSNYDPLPDIYPTTVFWTGVAAVRKDVFEAVGGFDHKTYPTVGLEDIDFGRRAVQAGFHIFLNKSVVVSHHFPATLWQNFKGHYQRGFQWIQLYYRYGKFDNYLTTPVQAFGRLAAFGSFIIMLTGWWIPYFWLIIGLFGVVYLSANHKFIRLVSREEPQFLVQAMFIDYILAVALGFAALRGSLHRLKML